MFNQKLNLINFTIETEHSQKPNEIKFKIEAEHDKESNEVRFRVETEKGEMRFKVLPENIQFFKKKKLSVQKLPISKHKTLPKFLKFLLPPQFDCFAQYITGYFYKIYLYYNNFIKFIFNKYFYIYIRSFFSEKVTYWTLFSYTLDKYYQSINRLIPYQNSLFLKNNFFKKDNLFYLKNLVLLKRKNVRFKSKLKWNITYVTNFFRYNKNHYKNAFLDIGRHFTNLTKNNLTKKHNSKPQLSRIFNYNFKYKTKLLLSHNRKILLKLLNFKLKRQYRITKFISKFIKNKTNKSFNYFELTLNNVLISSKFALTLKQAFFLIKKACVYVNGVKKLDPLYKVKINDVIQIIFTIDYFNNYKFFFNLLTKMTYKYHNRFFKKPFFKKRFLKKQNLNQWLIDLSMFRKGTPRFIEVDFLTLSIIVIYIPYNSHFITYNTNKIYNFYLNRLYNWKYLT